MVRIFRSALCFITTLIPAIEYRKEIIMKSTRTTIAVIILAALLTCFSFIFPVAATDNPSTLTVQSVTAQAGKAVDVQIVMNNNPGIIGMTLDVDYNSSAMTLVQVIDGGILGMSTHKPELTSPYTLSWSNDTAAENLKGSGVIATLRFAVSTDAAVGEYPITLSYDYDNYDIYNVAIEPVYFKTEAGCVAVNMGASEKPLLGDADSDGIITILDVTTIQRQLLSIAIKNEKATVERNGDVNGDGLDITDATWIQRYLVNIPVNYPIGKPIFN